MPDELVEIMAPTVFHRYSGDKSTVFQSK